MTALEAPPPSAPAGAALVEGIGLRKSFRGRRVVNDVSVSLRQGEIVGLLGPNGAGKTTTFYLMVGLIRAEAGRVLLDGTDVSKWPMYKRARHGIGYLSQEPSVFRKLTVEENVRAILERRRLPKQEESALLERMLEELSIAHLRKSMAYSLSGGERRRLEITRALVSEPKFMLLDEPFAGVDPIAVHDIQSIVAGLRHRGIGVLITDHNVEQTLDIVDRAYIMTEGRVARAGTVQELVCDEEIARLYLGPTLTARLRARWGAVHENRAVTADIDAPGAAGQPAALPGHGHALHAHDGPAAAPQAGAAVQPLPGAAGAGGGRESGAGRHQAGKGAAAEGR